ncbi:MAG: hypothetical protein V3U80_04560 [Flavobacteriaceae bacterium]
MKKLFILVAFAITFALMSFTNSAKKIKKVDPLLYDVCDEEATAAADRWGWSEQEEGAWFWECIEANQ